MCSLLFFLLHLVQISPSRSLFLHQQYYYYVYNLLTQGLFFFFLALHTKYKNVKPAVLGMLPKETVLLKILFLPKYFQSIWKGVKPQWLSVVFPFTISAGTPSTALRNWRVFQEKIFKKRLHETVWGLRIILLGPVGMNTGHTVAKHEIFASVSCSWRQESNMTVCLYTLIMFCFCNAVSNLLNFWQLGIRDWNYLWFYLILISDPAVMQIRIVSLGIHYSQSINSAVGKRYSNAARFAKWSYNYTL